MFAVLLAAATLAAAQPAADPSQAAAPASEPHTVSPATATGVQDPGNKVVCWYEAPSGTHQRKRLCAKQRELDAMKRNADEFMTHRPQDPPKPLGVR
jgi:hypothetical protein